MLSPTGRISSLYFSRVAKSHENQWLYGYGGYSGYGLVEHLHEHTESHIHALLLILGKATTSFNQRFKKHFQLSCELSYKEHRKNIKFLEK